MADEQTYYNDDAGVRVTSTRFIVGSTTYPLTGITSVTTGMIRASRGNAIWMIVIGLLVAFFGFKMSAGIGMIGVLLIAGGAIWLYTIKDQHVLRIATAAGETNALKTKGTPEYVDHVARALNEAIAARG